MPSRPPTPRFLSMAFIVIGGQEDDVVGLEDGVGLLAVPNFFDVDLDDDALVSFRADEAEIVVASFKADAAAERGELQQGQRGGLVERDGGLVLEGAEHIDEAGAGDLDDVARVDEHACVVAGGEVRAEVDDDGLLLAVGPGANDPEGVAGVGGQAAGGRDDVDQAAGAGDGNDILDFAGDDDGAVDGLEDLEDDYRVPEKSAVAQALGDEGLGLTDGEALKRDVADEWELDDALRSEADGGLVVGLEEDADGDEVARAEQEVVAGIEHRLVGQGRRGRWVRSGIGPVPGR